MTDSACLVCGCHVLRKTAVIGGYRIWRCGDCAFCWVDRHDLVNLRSEPDYNNYEYNQILTERFEGMKPYYLSGFRQRVDRYLSRRDLGTCAFLDIGCANGEYLWVAGQTGFGVTSGVEIDEVAAARAAEYGEVVPDINKLSCRCFDIIQIKNVLSNITDPVRFVQECLRLLAPGGVLFLDVVNQDSLTSILRTLSGRNSDKTGRYGPLRPPYVINGFNPASLCALFRTLGLSQTWFKTSYLGHPHVPYGTSIVHKSLGFAGSMMGRGSMLLTESVRSTVSREICS